MKPYKVKLTYETVVTAKSEDDARSEAHYHLCGTDEVPVEIEVEQCTKDTILPKGWRENCIPWGEGEERTISDHLNGTF
tara:strand:- start:1134 stop:1370 length:237 start_codon:yes stop_codon:yes gene_type:complete